VGEGEVELLDLLLVLKVSFVNVFEGGGFEGALFALGDPLFHVVEGEVEVEDEVGFGEV